MGDSENEGTEGKEGGESRATVLGAVKNPLVFYALALLIVEASLGVIVGVSGLGKDYIFYSVIIMSALFLIVVGVVTFLTYLVPANLMAQAKEVARNEARRVSEAAAKSTILLPALKKLQYELKAFKKNEKVDKLQVNMAHKGLSQNPFEAYIEPTIEGILGNPHVGPKTQEKLKALVSSPEVSVGQALNHLDRIVKSFD